MASEWSLGGEWELKMLNFLGLLLVILTSGLIDVLHTIHEAQWNIDEMKVSPKNCKFTKHD